MTVLGPGADPSLYYNSTLRKARRACSDYTSYFLDNVLNRLVILRLFINLTIFLIELFNCRWWGAVKWHRAYLALKFGAEARWRCLGSVEEKNRVVE